MNPRFHGFGIKADLGVSLRIQREDHEDICDKM
jgi:hypothetical protein